MEKLFSYGTLQNKQVQEETFGRMLAGTADALRGYRVSTVRIRDAEVIRKSGLEHHPILIKTGDPQDSVPGTVFEVSVEELERSDRYEVEEYVRIEEVFDSGTSAWVYVAAEKNGGRAGSLRGRA